MQSGDLVHSDPAKASLGARGTCIALGLTMLVCGIVLAAVALRLGPPVGDLTRISGLSERQYGWRRQAERYAQDHFRKLPLEELMAAGTRGGIVVFGDSFTDAEQPGTSWLNALHEKTGAAIDFVEYLSLADTLSFFDAPAVRAAPPRLVILQMAERTVFRRTRPLFGQGDCAPPPPPRAVPAAPSPDGLPLIPWTRRTQFDSFDELMSWGALALRRRVFASSKTVVVNLSRDDLFTSQRPGELLFYHSDIMRHAPEALYPLEAEQARRGIICALRHTIAAAPYGTEVHLLVAPDKRTAYAPYITDALPPKAIDFAALVQGALNGRNIDLFGPLSAAIARGERDVYYPNDTHWSEKTARKVAELVAAATFSPPGGPEVDVR